MTKKNWITIDLRGAQVNYTSGRHRHLAGRLERYPTATKRLCAVRAETPDRLYPDDERNLFHLMIWIRARFSLGVVILNWCSCGLWIAHPFSRTRRRTLKMPPCDTPVSLDIALWDSPRPDNRTMSSRIPSGILVCMIATLFWNCNSWIATAHNWVYSIQRWRNVFWSN